MTVGQAAANAAPAGQQVCVAEDGTLRFDSAEPGCSPLTDSKGHRISVGSLWKENYKALLDENGAPVVDADGKTFGFRGKEVLRNGKVALEDWFFARGEWKEITGERGRSLAEVGLRGCFLHLHLGGGVRRKRH